MASFVSRVIRCQITNRSWWIITAALTIAILVVYQGVGYRKDPQGTGQNTEVTHSHTNSQTKPHLVFGILSADGNRDLRDAQRNTWIAAALRLKEDLPFKFTYKFVLDLPTAKTLEENKTHGDIVYLNVTNHGYAFKYGEKIYLSLRYMFLNIPDVYMGVRMDDDVFLCVPQIFQRLDMFKSSKIYYGPIYNVNGKKVNKLLWNDDFFVVVGSELIERIAVREYCYDKKRCNESSQLIDMDWGANSLSAWLAIYDDVDLVKDNSRIIWFDRTYKPAQFAHFIKPDFCDMYVLFHKATMVNIRQLHTYNTKPLNKK